MSISIVCTFNGKSRPLEIQSDSIVIGRNSTNNQPDLDLGADKSISRKHARIWREDGKFWVEDLGSTLGTYVNGLRRPRLQIKFGDQIKVGQTVLEIMPSSLTDLGAE